MTHEDEVNLASDDESVENLNTDMQLEKNTKGKEKTSNEGVDIESLVRDESMRDESITCVNERPQLGMTFISDDEAFRFYNTYAKKIGFSVRKKNVSIRNGVIKRREFCCALQGSYTKKLTPKKRRDSRRCGCMAALTVKLDPTSKMLIVCKFVEEHNHPLEDSKNSHLLRSHRHIEGSQYNLIQNMRSSGIKPIDIFLYLSTEAGGAENLNFTRSDCYNLISKNRINFLNKGDAQCLLQYLTSKQEENKFFFYKLRTGEDNRICGCFIADSKSRCDYSNFGDVICFDTTYKTNHYNMICTPIIGVNHHAQTVLFGCGLLDCETIDSFVWLFEAFLLAMGKKQPKTIFTDQAAAIASAISLVFPEAHHRLCLWHIYQNAAKHLSAIFSKFQLFSQDFKSCIYDPETVEEFEESWRQLLATYELNDNDWLRNLYSLKEKWAQVFGRDHFCAGMTTTQRSESINKFLKKFFIGNHILREFVVQFDKALADCRMKEREFDMKNRQTTPNLLSKWDVEHEASIKYTRKIFQNFQEEYKTCFVLKLVPEGEDGITHYYSVREMKSTARPRSLTYTPTDQSVTCSCKKFEFHGIPCAHMLKLFNELELSTLPSRYYLRRWSMDIVKNIVYDSHGEVIVPDLDPLYTKRYSHLSHVAQTLAAKASITDEISIIVESDLLAIINKVDALTMKGNHVKTIHDSNNLSQSAVQVSLQNPINKKRVGPKTRLKSALEKRIKKKKDGFSREKSNDQNVIHDSQGSFTLPHHRMDFEAGFSTDLNQSFTSFTAMLQGTEVNPHPLMTINQQFNIEASSNTINNLVGQPNESASSVKKLDFGKM